MRVVIQKVNSCKVKQEGIVIRQIKEGLVFYIGIEQNDTYENQLEALNWLVEYIKHKKTLEVMLLSQFTLFAGFKKNNPSFHKAMKNDKALLFFKYVTNFIKSKNSCNFQVGVFGSYLKINVKSDDLNVLYLDFNQLLLTF